MIIMHGRRHVESSISAEECLVVLISAPGSRGRALLCSAGLLGRSSRRPRQRMIGTTVLYLPPIDWLRVLLNSTTLNQSFLTRVRLISNQKKREKYKH
jgi:hypothetical protein